MASYGYRASIDRKIEEALRRGFSQQEVLSYVRQRYGEPRVTEQAQPTPEPAPQQAAFERWNLLPMIGAIGGGILGGGAASVPMAMAGAGAGEAIEQQITGKAQPLGILGEMLLTGVGAKVISPALGMLGRAGKGLLGKIIPSLAQALPEERVVGEVAKAPAKGIAGWLTRAGQRLGIKALRPTPSQAARFTKETGEEIGEFLARKGLAGGSADDIVRVTQTLQSQFDDIARGASVKGDTILGNIGKKITELSASALPVENTKANVLRQAFESLQTQFKGKTLSGEIVTTLRQQVDDAVRGFGMDEVSKGPYQLLRDILQNSLREATEGRGQTVAGMSLKRAGVELSKLYRLGDIAASRAYVGVGRGLVGLPEIVGGAAGATAYGAPGAIPGIVAAKGATQLGRSPQLMSLLARGALGAGRGLGQPTGKLAQILGQAGVRLPGAIMGGGQAPTQQPTPEEISTISPMQQMAPQLGQQLAPQQQQQQQITPEMVTQAYLTLKKGDADRLLAAYKSQFLGEQRLPASLQGQMIGVSRAENLVDQFEQSLGEIGLEEEGPAARAGGIYRKIAASIGLRPDVRAYQALRAGSASLLIRALGEVGTLTDYDIKRAMALIPGVGDSVEEARRKLTQLREMIERGKQGIYQQSGMGQVAPELSQSLYGD